MIEVRGGEEAKGSGQNGSFVEFEQIYSRVRVILLWPEIRDNSWGSGLDVTRG